MSEEKEKKSEKFHRNFLLKGLLPPEWVPELWDTVVHVESGRKALVVEAPRDPTIYDIKPGMTTRPLEVPILLGEEELVVDVSELKAAS